MSQKVFNIIFSAAIVILGISNYYLRSKMEEIKPPDIRVEYTVDEKQLDFFNKSPQEGLMEALEYYEVKHPQIVYAQAILETGHFESYLCLSNNNLFGLYDSKKHKYYTFNHWSHSVEAYIKMIQYKYKEDNEDPPDSYYKFLSDIGYAKDPNYVNKLKRIVSRNDKRRSE